MPSRVLRKGTLQFARHKRYEEIRAQCEAQGVPLDDEKLRTNRDWDTVCVGTKECGYAIYNTWSGRFIGRTNTGTRFDSYEVTYDKKPWMQALLNFFYTNEDPK